MRLELFSDAARLVNWMQRATTIAEALRAISAAAAAAAAAILWQEPLLHSHQHVRAVRRLVEGHGINALEFCEATCADLAAAERPKLQGSFRRLYWKKQYLRRRSGASRRAVQIGASALQSMGVLVLGIGSQPSRSPRLWLV